MKMNSSLGVNLRVTGHCNQGDRKYMEDMFCVAYQQTEDEEDLEYAYFGIFDGHGGKEAAVFARERLMEFIVNEKKFWSDDDEDVLSAIKSGYLATHNAMWKELANWPPTLSGLPSTSGTTATIAFIRNGKIYVGHVGDSSLVLGYQTSPGPPHEKEWKAEALTEDHKPESQEEITRIVRSGGKVKSKSGVARVVWNRPRIGHKGPVRRSTPIDEIPFLAVARSLGDLWSYNSDSNQFVVSPEPDVMVVKIDTSIHRCLIFGTDGFWNMVSPSEAVRLAQEAIQYNEAQMSQADDQQNSDNNWVNPSKHLVKRALLKWKSLYIRADNTSVVTLLLNPTCSQGGCQLSKTAIVSHNHDVEPVSLPPILPETMSQPLMPLPVTSPEALALPLVDSENSEPFILPLTNVISHLPVPSNAISLHEETKHTNDFEDFRQEKPYSSDCKPRLPEPAIQCGDIDSSTCDVDNLRESKAVESGFSGGDARPVAALVPERPASLSPVLNPLAASTPAAFPRSNAFCFSRSAALKAAQAPDRRVRMPPPTRVVLNGAGPAPKNGVPYSSNSESNSHVRGLKRRHSSVWDRRNGNAELRDMKKRTRSEDKPVLAANVCNSTSDKYDSEDAENERVSWPTNWMKKMRPCAGDGGSEENCAVRRKKKWIRSSGSPLSGIRQGRSRSSAHLFLERREHSRTLRSDTNAASQSRTLRSRNVDVRSPLKLPVLASKIASAKRSVHVRALGSDLSPFSRNNLLQASKSATPSPRRRARTVGTRSRV